MVIMWSSRTFQSILSSVKDKVPTKKQSDVVYKIHCSYKKVCLRETRRRLKTRLKGHTATCKRGQLEKSAVAEHAWMHQNAIKWEETSVVDQVRRDIELLLKEALRFHLAPAGERLNQDEDLELPGC